MSQKYLLSVIIPTKDREAYAAKAVEQVLGIDCEELQVVVQDNSVSGALHDILEKFNSDKRLKYNRTTKVISFVENFSIAVGLADGEYLCLIGDDDGILPQIINAVRWAKENNIVALKPELSIVYFWPNSTALKAIPDNGYLHVGKMRQKATVFEPQSEVRKLMQRGCIDYLSLEMAKLYHGIIRKSCLEEVHEKTGKYFGGLSPDIYSSVALSLTVDKIVKLGFPLTISGICSRSGSADSATGKHKGKLENAPHFRGHNNYNWSSEVPRIYSVETIWADSALAAIRDLGRYDLLAEFNDKALIVNCLFKYPEFKEEIIKNFASRKKGTSRSMSALWISFFGYTVQNFFTRFLRRIVVFPDSSIKVQGIVDIVEAGRVLGSQFSGKLWDGSPLQLTANNTR